MTGLYEYWSLPHKLSIKCPSCQHKANFEFARFAKIQLKKDIDYFQQHPDFEYQRFADLAQQFNFSERNLKRRFQLATQISPNQYLQQVRVDKAKKLLLTTDMKIQQIAYEVGYENVSFFIRIFKKVTACTPTQWVK
ncbi:helix-turn-helix domain-containing protein [Acinetobacter sp. 5862]|uniref:helix-turn-helix domain-containing protein n=1 Tax=Acinetobacter sp. 5862 TaxID=2967169 RepID=UPI002113774F|nr:helix-turn-helix transcriptional regulator [Acinetobacter sp. 5862]